MAKGANKLRKLIQKISEDSLQDRNDMRALQFLPADQLEALDDRQKALRLAGGQPTSDCPIWLKESLEWCHTIMRVEAQRPTNHTLNVIGSVTVNQMSQGAWDQLAATVDKDTQDKRDKFLEDAKKVTDVG